MVKDEGRKGKGKNGSGASRAAAPKSVFNVNLASVPGGPRPPGGGKTKVMEVKIGEQEAQRMTQGRSY